MEKVIAGQEFQVLLQTARSGSREALGKLFALFRAYLLSIAEGELEAELRPKGSGKDLVQDAFLQAQQLLDRFTGSRPDEFRAWLRAVLLNKVAEFRKRYQNAQSRQVSRETSLDTDTHAGPLRDSIPDDASTPSAAVVRSERAEQLARALARLSESQRDVIRLRNWDGLSFVQIGQRMGKSEDAARQLWGRAIERLQQELEGLL